MIDKIKKLLALVKLARDVKDANVDAEKQGALRFLKVLGAGALVAISRLAIEQTGTGCVLGEKACKILADPTVGMALVAAIVGIEKWANEKWGIGVQPLDTVKRN